MKFNYTCASEGYPVVLLLRLWGAIKILKPLPRLISTWSAGLLAHLFLLEEQIRCYHLHATFLPNSRKRELFLPWAP